MKGKYDYFKDSLINANILNIIKTTDDWRVSQIVERSLGDVRGILRSLEDKKRTFFYFQKLINLHKMIMLDKFTLIFSCIFLFLSGASLGAIIKKGGLGLPLVLSVLIFLSYHYIGIFAKNAAEDNSFHPILASWISMIFVEGRNKRFRRGNVAGPKSFKRCSHRIANGTTNERSKND